MNDKPGPLGTFSQGRSSADDEGDLLISIDGDKERGLVRLEFGTLVAWIELPPEQAITFARLIYANAVSVQNAQPLDRRT